MANTPGRVILKKKDTGDRLEIWDDIVHSVISVAHFCIVFPSGTLCELGSLTHNYYFPNDSNVAKYCRAHPNLYVSLYWPVKSENEK